MRALIKRSCALTLAALLTPVAAHATNGMFLIGVGSRSVSMGGASVGNPQDSFTGAYNPAAIAAINTRADIDGTIFIPKAAARLGNTHVESSSDLYLMPAMGLIMPIDNETIIGFSAVPVGGGGSNYRTNFYDKAVGNVGVNLLIMNMNPTLAQRLDKNNSVGFSLIIGVQRFKAWGLSTFTTFTVTQNSAVLTDRGSEFTYGVGGRLGWLGTYDFLDMKLGAAYTSETRMKPFDNYKGLFADHGDFDTPGNIAVGASFKPTSKSTVALDIVRTFYSGVRAVSNPGPNVVPGPQSWAPVSQEANSLGADNGLGFGWRDQTVYKLGLEYVWNNKWSWRAGWNYGKSPIPQEREILFNLVAPATTEKHLTLGGTYKIDKGRELNFAYMHAFTTTQSGPTYITTNLTTDPKTGTIEMYQNAFSVGIGFTL